MQPSVDNVLDMYRRATPEWRAEGMAWYDDAHNLACSLIPKDPRRAAGVIAALSPMTGWSTNQAWAKESCRTGVAVGNTLPNRAKAQLILDGADPADILTSPKVGAFFRSIADPTDINVSPVIDRHAFSIAVGEWTHADTASRFLGRKGVYEEFASVYRQAAFWCEIGAAQMQAVTWVTFRHLLGKGWY